MALHKKYLTYIAEIDFEHFDLFVEKPNGEDGCWIWTGSTSANNGYPDYSAGSNVHRSPSKILYLRHIGLPKTGHKASFRLLRTCENEDRLCVNPHHKKVLPLSADKRKRNKKKRYNRKRLDECGRGHDLTRAGARLKDGRCRDCKAIRNKKETARRAKVKQEVPWYEQAQELLKKY